MQSVRVLIVDDIGTVRAVVQNILVALGVKEESIFQASTGDHAVRVIESEKPHLIITDWTMPGASGIEVAKFAKSTSPKTKIVFLTSNSHRNEVLDAVQAGANDYVIKPFTRSQLVQKLSFWLSQVRTSLSIVNP